MRQSARPLAVAAVAAVVALLAACGTSPPKRSVYYQDDGPPERVPSDIAAIPDAVPRIEPSHRATNKPYTVLGRTYTPLSGDVAFRQRGMASWYGRQFHGNRTANGETYDMFAMTAAHPILPIPSYVRVTNVRTGRSVIVRVNDRGPFKHDRVIDLSYAAAAKLGIAAAGTGEVEVERITSTQIARGEYRRGDATARSAEAEPGRTEDPQAAPATNAPATVTIPTSTVTPVVATRADTATREIAPSASDLPMPLRGWSVQLGAFEQETNAEALVGRTAALLSFLDPAALTSGAPRIERDGAVYRVLVGASADRATAQALAIELERVLERPTTLLLR
jgi:rare lipoprotein A